MGEGRVSRRVWKPAMLLRERRRRRDRATRGASLTDLGRTVLLTRFRSVEGGEGGSSALALFAGRGGRAKERRVRKVVVVGTEKEEVTLESGNVLGPDGLERADLEDVAWAGGAGGG